MIDHVGQNNRLTSDDRASKHTNYEYTGRYPDVLGTNQIGPSQINLKKHASVDLRQSN